MRQAEDISNLKKTVIYSLVLSPGVAALATSIFFCVSKNVQATKTFDDFKNSEVFQQLKAEELEDFSELEITYNDAVKKNEAGEMSAKDFLAIQKKFNEKKDYAESEQFVYDGMKQAGIYKDYNTTKTEAVFADCSIVIGPVLIALGAFLVNDFILEAEDPYYGVCR